MTEAYNMDCMEYMRSLPDKAFDLAVVDPPYGIGADMFNNGSGASKDKRIYGTAQRIRKNRLNSGGGKLRNRKLNTSDCSWDSSPPSEDYFSELFRVTKNQVIWGGNYFSLGPCREILVWDKKQPWENFSQVEIAWTSFDGPAAIFRMCNTMGGKIHPTQKPVELYRWIYKKFAKPGDKSSTRILAAAAAGSRPMTPGWTLWDARSTRCISNCKSSALNGIRRSSTCFWRRKNDEAIRIKAVSPGKVGEAEM